MVLCILHVFYKLLVACPLSRRGFFLAKRCVSGFLDLHLVRFGQILSDLSDLVRFGGGVTPPGKKAAAAAGEGSPPPADFQLLLLRGG